MFFEPTNRLPELCTTYISIFFIHEVCGCEKLLEVHVYGRQPLELSVGQIVLLEAVRMLAFD
jgi:hypothetical protein